jgi:hypothetical protein
MVRRFLAAFSILAIILLVAFAVVLNARNPRASTALQRIAVLSQTRGNEVLTAELLNGQVTIRLKNNHKDTITAFAIKLDDTTIKADFAYSEVHFGIEPGDTFERSYPYSNTSSEPRPLQLLTVILMDGTKDGNSKIAQEIRDERLGEKIQILRTLKLLEGQSPADLKTTRSDIVTALETTESETLASLSELSPTPGSDNKLSDALKAGLQWGREKMLQAFDNLEKLPTEERRQAFTEFKARSQKLVSKL